MACSHAVSARPTAPADGATPWSPALSALTRTPPSLFPSPFPSPFLSLACLLSMLLISSFSLIPRPHLVAHDAILNVVSVSAHHWRRRTRPWSIVAMISRASSSLMACVVRLSVTPPLESIPNLDALIAVSIIAPTVMVVGSGLGFSPRPIELIQDPCVLLSECDECLARSDCGWCDGSGWGECKSTALSDRHEKGRDFCLRQSGIWHVRCRFPPSLFLLLFLHLLLPAPHLYYLSLRSCERALEQFLDLAHSALNETTLEETVNNLGGPTYNLSVVYIMNPQVIANSEASSVAGTLPWCLISMESYADVVTL